MILRKLGIPVQQIADILDGDLPLQKALDDNIASLNDQIDALNGALALTKQLRQENRETLDTDRCWELIQTKESQGFRFHELVDDYLKFTELNYEWLLWPLPGDSLRHPWKVAAYILCISAIVAFANMPLGVPFFLGFFTRLINMILVLAAWTVVFIPIFLLRRRKPRLAEGILTFLLIAVPIACVLLFCYILYLGANP